jgi:hypothetical protein
MLGPGAEAPEFLQRVGVCMQRVEAVYLRFFSR